MVETAPSRIAHPREKLGNVGAARKDTGAQKNERVQRQKPRTRTTTRVGTARARNKRGEVVEHEEEGALEKEREHEEEGALEKVREHEEEGAK
jgi:hypothetical protein